MQQAFILNVQLLDVEPTVQRRIVVSSDTLLPKLHKILQAVMGWEDAHMHQFIVGRTFYCSPIPEFMENAVNSKAVKIGQLLQRKGSKILYEYDFGDGWMHEIKLEKTVDPNDYPTLPLCLAGENACPPEDCGGPWGFAELMETLKHPEDPGYPDAIEWLGEDYSPQLFDLEAVQKMLKRLQEKKGKN